MQEVTVGSLTKGKKACGGRGAAGRAGSHRQAWAACCHRHCCARGAAAELYELDGAGVTPSAGAGRQMTMCRLSRLPRAGGAVCSAWRIHAHLQPQAPAWVHREGGRAAGQGRGHHCLRVCQRCVCHGRLGQERGRGCAGARAWAWVWCGVVCGGDAAADTIVVVAWRHWVRPQGRGRGPARHLVPPAVAAPRVRPPVLSTPHPADGKVLMLADGSAVFAQSIGAELDLTDKGLGVRSRR